MKETHAKVKNPKYFFSAIHCAQCAMHAYLLGKLTLSEKWIWLLEVKLNYVKLCFKGIKLIFLNLLCRCKKLWNICCEHLTFNFQLIKNSVRTSLTGDKGTRPIFLFSYSFISLLHESFFISNKYFIKKWLAARDANVDAVHWIEACIIRKKTFLSISYSWAWDRLHFKANLNLHSKALKLIISNTGALLFSFYNLVLIIISLLTLMFDLFS